ncbi:LysR substrate-binding domain-containing protein [Thalassospira sp.]|uniref:LysR substrate-binding domain-containing protein n=1 Tax=Thalassospira sp. TaxID=1912094 RepID=UPI0025EBE5E7|nr:LysR substrate-binding domain-containing protein [Thalassospira sp.]
MIQYSKRNLVKSNHLKFAMKSEKLNSEISGWLPSLKSIRALETVARHGSFQQAAEELGVSPAAVHQLVRGLEDVIGQDLVIRDGRNVAITRAAEAGLAELHVAFGNLSAGVRKIREYDGRRQLRISVDPSFAQAWLVGRLGRFQADNPEIDILLDSTTRFADVAHGHADVALRYTKEVQGDLKVVRFFEDETIAVCSPSLIADKKRPLDIASMAEFSLLHFDWTQSAQIQLSWQRWVSLVGGPALPLSGGARFNDYNAVVQAAIAGQGIALVGRPLVNEALRTGILTEPFGCSYRNGYGYFAIRAPGDEGREDNYAEKFVSWVVEESERDKLKRPNP